MAFMRAKLTLEEYWGLPESNQPCELIDGELFMPPSPNILHQRVVLRLASHLDEHVRSQGLGKSLSHLLTSSWIVNDPWCFTLM